MAGFLTRTKHAPIVSANVNGIVEIESTSGFLKNAIVWLITNIIDGHPQYLLASGLRPM
jgi:hypothetical protein